MSAHLPLETNRTVLPRQRSSVHRTDSMPDGFAAKAVLAHASAIYEGWVRHRRFAPQAHEFDYRICMLYVDLAEVDKLFERRWLWSRDRRNVAEFRRSDYFGDPAMPIDEAVRNRIESESGTRPLGPIRLLTHLRYFGHCFNPVSFYYCYAEDGATLVAILAEITNTPWKERHAYVLPVTTAEQRGAVLSWQFAKAFHVSPFLPMQCRYDWRFTVPGETLRVHMDVSQARAGELLERTFDATLVLERREFNAANLARVLTQHPLMTIKVVAAIHWQALRLWLRGNPVYDHAPRNASSDDRRARMPATDESTATAAATKERP